MDCLNKKVTLNFFYFIINKRQKSIYNKGHLKSWKVFIVKECHHIITEGPQALHVVPPIFYVSKYSAIKRLKVPHCTSSLSIFFRTMQRQGTTGSTSAIVASRSPSTLPTTSRIKICSTNWAENLSGLKKNKICSSNQWLVYCNMFSLCQITKKISR